MEFYIFNCKDRAQGNIFLWKNMYYTSIGLFLGSNALYFYTNF